VTMLVASKKGKRFPPVRTCLTYSAILKPCAHATLNYDRLGRTGSPSEGQDRRTAGGPLRDVNV
jgi:hypothetical protein